jgi:hypothetical protein
VAVHHGHRNSSARNGCSPWSSAIALGQVAPRRTRAQHPEDAIQHPSVIDTRHASRLIGQKWLDHAPLEVRQVISAPDNPGSENHARGNPFYGFTTWLYNVGDPSAQALVAWQISIARA